jgi:hypothetical protein
MATSPQPQLRTSADRQHKDLRRRQEASLWARLREPDSQLGAVWRVGSAREEARALFRMLGRNGDDVNSLRALISLTPKEKAELADWAACTSPLISVRIEAMLTYRREVLLQFNRLVASSQNTDALPQRAGLSSHMS